MLEKKDIIIWGTGLIGRQCFKLIHDEYKLPIKYFIDSSVCDINKQFCGCRIFSPDILYNEKEKCTLIIASTKYEKQISDTIIQMGMYYLHDCYTYKDIIHSICKIRFDIAQADIHVFAPPKLPAVFYDFQVFSKIFSELFLSFD